MTAVHGRVAPERTDEHLWAGEERAARLRREGRHLWWWPLTRVQAAQDPGGAPIALHLPDLTAAPLADAQHPVAHTPYVAVQSPRVVRPDGLPPRVVHERVRHDGAGRTEALAWQVADIHSVEFARLGAWTSCGFQATPTGSTRPTTCLRPTSSR